MNEQKAIVLNLTLKERRILNISFNLNLLHEIFKKLIRRENLGISFISLQQRRI